MAIQYSGLTIVNQTFAAVTRRNIVDGIATALAAAGWSCVSGAGTADQWWRCVATPQGFQAEVRLYDPGANNCAQLQLRNVGGAVAPAQIIYILPAIGKTCRIIASGYQFVCFNAAGVDNSATLLFTVPYCFQTCGGFITNVAILNSSRSGDATSGTICLRSHGYQASSGMQATILNTGSSGAQYNFKPMLPTLCAASGAGDYGDFYADGSVGVHDAQFAITGVPNPPTSLTSGQYATGFMLWDVCYTSIANLVLDQMYVVDSRNWWNITPPAIAIGAILFLVP